jgi:hypothetical protein
VALHLLPWTILGLIAYYGRIGVALITIGIAFECILWYRIEKQRALNYVSLVLSNRPKWDIEKSMQDYVEYVKSRKTKDK